MSVVTKQSLRANRRFPASRKAFGFSLIELLVVIAVVAVLVGVLLPVLGQVREQGRASACMSNLRQIGAVWQVYCVDNPTQGLIPWDPVERHYWYQYLLGRVGANTAYLNGNTVPQCPSWQPPNPNTTAGGYAMTDLLLWGPPSRRVRQVPNFYTALLQKPSDWPVFMDADTPAVYSLNDPTEGANAGHRWAARHDGRAHVLMADQHVEVMTGYGDKRWSEPNLNDGTHY